MLKLSESQIIPNKVSWPIDGFRYHIEGLNVLNQKVFPVLEDIVD